MIRVLFLVLALLISSQIFRYKGAKKIAWFLGAILFLPQTIIVLETPFMPISRFMAIILLLSTLIQYKNWWLEFKHFPFKTAITILFISLLLIGIVDDRVGMFFRLFRFFTTFVETFAIFFLCYFHIRNVKDVLYIYNFLVKCFVVFCLYGAFNWITNTNLYSQFLASALNFRDIAAVYGAAGGDRFRISSFAWHPIYYGLELGLMILLVVYLLGNIKLAKAKRNFYFFALACLCLNLLWTNSRTPLIATFAGLGVFFLLGFDIVKKLKYGALGVALILGFIMVSPSSFSIIEQTVDTFSSKGSKLEGSSVEMRDMQMQSSLAIFFKKPIFGHGFSYIVEGLGFGDSDNRNSDSSLAGFESYSYKLLIEQGSVGIASNVFLLISILYYLFKKRQYLDMLGKRLAYSVMGSVVVFVLFILGTGDMGSFLFFMSLLGINIKMIDLMASLKKTDLNQNNNISTVTVYAKI